MYAKKRQAQVLDIIAKQGYATVKQLVNELHYSSATINRDLNALEAEGHIKRSYGGAEPVKNITPKLKYRYSLMKVEKRHIGKIAAGLVNDNETLFIDASTTAEFMAQYLIEKKGITVITNNMALVSFLSENGVNVVCLGGNVVESPSMLGGDSTVEMLEHYVADKAFFSTGSITEDGRLGSSDDLYDALHRTMTRNAKESYYLADHRKVDGPAKHFLCNISKLTAVITDYNFPAETINKYPNTKFITE